MMLKPRTPSVVALLAVVMATVLLWLAVPAAAPEPAPAPPVATTKSTKPKMTAARYQKILAYAAALKKARYEAILRIAAWDAFMKRRAAYQRFLDFVAAVDAAKHQAGPPYGVWDRVAVCESGGNWASTEGHYEGGLQFDPGTWLAMGGGQYAPHAYLATRGQQIAVAERLLARAGWGQWPACSSKLGLR